MMNDNQECGFSERVQLQVYFRDVIDSLLADKFVEGFDMEITLQEKSVCCRLLEKCLQDSQSAVEKLEDCMGDNTPGWVSKMELGYRHRCAGFRYALSQLEHVKVVESDADLPI